MARQRQVVTVEVGVGAVQTESCAHCGHAEELARAMHCTGCLYVYCVDHGDPESHHCVVVCRECDSEPMDPLAA